jgi:2-haloacid dehalogenase
LLEAMRDAGMRLYALTNWSAEKFELTYPRFEWLSWFEGIVVSGRERVVKPDPRIYRTLLDRYDVDPRAAVYIDDVPHNVTAAAALGLTALHFAGPDQLHADLTELGVLHNGAVREADG